MVRYRLNAPVLITFTTRSIENRQGTNCYPKFLYVLPSLVIHIAVYDERAISNIMLTRKVDDEKPFCDAPSLLH
jgi:hypothetical protein